MLPEAKYIKKQRKALGLSQADLAIKTNISRTSLVKLENGDADLRYSKVKEIFDTLEKLDSNRNLTSFFQNTSLKEIHSREIKFVSVDERLRDVSTKMIETTFSQFPVKDGNKIVGSVTEIEINAAISEHGENAVDLKISEIMAEPFPIIGANAPVSSVVELLRNVQAILTTENGAVVGIVTNTDPYKKLVK